MTGFIPKEKLTAYQRWEVAAFDEAEQAARQAAKEAAAAHADDDFLPDRALIPVENHIVLIGFGRVGSRVGRALHEKGLPLVLIESDRDDCIEARKLGIPCILGNAVSPGVLADANLASARALLVAIPQTLEAGPIIKQAREANPGIAIPQMGDGPAPGTNGIGCVD